MADNMTRLGDIDFLRGTVSPMLNNKSMHSIKTNALVKKSYLNRRGTYPLLKTERVEFPFGEAIIVSILIKNVTRKLYLPKIYNSNLSDEALEKTNDNVYDLKYLGPEGKSHKYTFVSKAKLKKRNQEKSMESNEEEGKTKKEQKFSKKIYNVIVNSIITYGGEVWRKEERTEGMLRAIEMDFWRRSAGISRRERIRNVKVREIMDVENDIVHDIRPKQLVWYGHVRRMTDDRLPKQVFDWVPPGRRRRGRPMKGWRQGVEAEIRRVIAEHREADPRAVEALPYYGGAKGKYLIIHPSGRTSIVDRNSELLGLRDDDEEGGVGEAGTDEVNTSETAGPSDGVEINPPPDNASVAEAKPVGLAIAGAGGVASSKPVATAVVGPGGLAIANPRATAIAGLAGAEQLIGIGGKKKITLDVNSGSTGSTSGTTAAKSRDIRFNSEQPQGPAQDQAQDQNQPQESLPKQFSMIGNSAQDFRSLPRVIYYPITLY
ncbi:unnamed protein product [Bemisia tabaci]|uniref:DUF4774 domain-containing protein n=1 Tax=Bemisia tabaci TaxID=7038 RepID=A0A9P0A7X8_BEMTA|nr:unnamed protein product [Bemisia tabaci]